MSTKHDKHNKNKEEEDSDSINNLNINEEFAERFKHNEKRKEMEKNKNKYGTTFRKKIEKENSDSDGDQSPEESEDSEGELDNEIVRDKFINTLLELKDEKETKKLMENKTPIFTDDDFKQKREKIHKKEENEKINYGIKDALLDNKNDGSENEDNDSNSENNVYSVNYKPKKIEEDQTEKNAFISAANKDENESDNSDENDDKDFFDNGLLLKKKTNKDTFVDLDNDKDNKEESENKNETPEEAEEKIAKMTLSEALKKSKIKTKNVNMNLLEQIWGDDKKLSKDERFLRNYILSEGWLDKNTTGLNKNLLLIDKEDEENEDKFDAFENKYNHRYEEEGGANITTYQRNIDSYRHKDDTRATKRKEHDKRKEEEKKKFKEELKTKKLKQAEEIKEKINKLERIAGTEKIGELLEEFENKDFNMDEFDQKMNDIFNKEYYNQELDEEEMEKFDAKQERHLKLEEKEEENEDKNENNNEENDNDELWFYCDSCKKPLKEGKIKYECKTCEDYTLCKKCYKSKGHEHQMKKDIVPAGCNPPENAEELIKKVENENETNILKCSRCQKIIVENKYYICNEESCANLKYCMTCRGLGKNIHDHKLHKFIIKENEESDDEQNKKTNTEKLQALIDEKANYNIDDVIDGELGTKFHYTKVPKEDSGLTDDMLLLLDDKVLNKYLPLKKITAYNDYKLPSFKKKAMLNRLEKLVNKKKKELAQDYEDKYQNEKENEKLLIGHKTKGEHEEEDNDKNNKIKEKNKDKDKYKNKDKHNKNNKNKGENNDGNHKQKLSRDEFKKQKRLETYGISE